MNQLPKILIRYAIIRHLKHFYIYINYIILTKLVTICI